MKQVNHIIKVQCDICRSETSVITNNLILDRKFDVCLSCIDTLCGKKLELSVEDKQTLNKLINMWRNK